MSASTGRPRPDTDLWFKPPRHHHAPKLTPRQRDEIRQRLADGEKPAVLAAEYSVTAHTIRRHR